MKRELADVVGDVPDRVTVQGEVADVTNAEDDGLPVIVGHVDLAVEDVDDLVDAEVPVKAAGGAVPEVRGDEPVDRRGQLDAARHGCALDHVVGRDRRVLEVLTLGVGGEDRRHETATISTPAASSTSRPSRTA